MEVFVKNKTITQSAETLCEHLNYYGFVNIVKINAASHPAYRCQSLAHLSNNPYKQASAYFPNDYLDRKFGELKDMQVSAMMDGLCKAYPQTLAIVHIAASAL